jgi:hypothetical protein
LARAQGEIGDGDIDGGALLVERSNLLGCGNIGGDAIDDAGVAGLDLTGLRIGVPEGPEREGQLGLVVGLGDVPLEMGCLSPGCL